MARIDSAYNYFLTTYGQNLGSRYESHKKSELRETYNSIIKTNKESPLYKIVESSNIGQLAIDIKERANSVALAISELTLGTDDIQSILDKRVATSSDDLSVTANYVGDSDASVNSFDIKVDALATPQVNTGRFLDPTMRSFEEGQYSFDLDVKNGSYEFQFNVNSMDNNLDVQNKIVRLVNSADVGLSAQLISDDNGDNAIEIQSKSTGLSSDEPYIFNIESNTCWRELNTLGIGNVSSAPTNSSFRLNGIVQTSLSNTFTVNKAFELTLNAPSEDTVHIGIMADTDALGKGINGLLDSYNNMIDLGNKRLASEVSGIGKSMASSLESIGIVSDENNHLILDSDALATNINSVNRESSFEILNNFKNALLNQAKKTSINPMNYVDKVIVEYKNPNNTLAYPYAASQYSGMLVNYQL